MLKLSDKGKAKFLPHGKCITKVCIGCGTEKECSPYWPNLCEECLPKAFEADPQYKKDLDQQIFNKAQDDIDGYEDEDE